MFDRIHGRIDASLSLLVAFHITCGYETDLAEAELDREPAAIGPAGWLRR